MYCLRAITCFTCVALGATSAAAQSTNTDPAGVRVVTSDVANFWRAYDELALARTWDDSLQAIEDLYLDQASPGLREFSRIRLEGPEDLLRAVNLAPAYYSAVRDQTLGLGKWAPAIRESLRALQGLYPEAVFPDIYFLIVGFISQGTLTDVGLYIGAEMVSADAATPLDELPAAFRVVDLTPSVIPCIVVHELVHYQQDYSRGNSVLRQALREGVADFMTMQAVGCTPTAAAVYDYGKRHEAALWAEFREVMHGTDFGPWFYNAATSTDRPANLGYWMGYQIASAYFDRAVDKQQAVHDLLHIGDAGEILTRSGYDGGN